MFVIRCFGNRLQKLIEEGEGTRYSETLTAASKCSPLDGAGYRAGLDTYAPIFVVRKGVGPAVFARESPSSRSW